MISLLINDQKDFSRKLFLAEVFDSFLVPDAEFVTDYSAEFHSGGAIFAEVPPVCWSALRPVAFQIIKGSRLPRRFRIVLRRTDEEAAAAARDIGFRFEENDIPSLFFNIRYDGSRMTVTTGSSQKAFNPDRSLDHAWDQAAREFLLGHQIDFSPLA